MKQYEQYQNCDTPWIKEVPSHWSKLRYKDIMRPKDVKVGDNLPTLLSLTKGGVIIRDISEGKGKFPSDFSSYKVVTPNDFIMCLFDVDETPRTVGIAHNDGMITGAYDIFNIVNANREFLLYHFLYLDDKKALKPLYKGLRKVVPLPSLLSSYVYLPPIDEQDAIVEYLDSKTSKIDSYVAERERELQSLEELKHSEIAHIVTHGLNPDVPMRDSGIPWLGQIPAHWKTEKINAHFKERRVKVSDKDYPALSVAKIGVVPQLEDAVKTDNGDNRKLVKQGDFVVNSRSDRKGSCGVAPQDGSVSLINIVLEIIDMDRDYVHFLFRSNNYIEEFYRNGRGIVADLWTTRYSEMKNIIIPVPPIEEQKAIVDYINDKTSKIDSLISDLTAQIEKLKEYKQRLIADVVTGQIDVRK